MTKRSKKMAGVSFAIACGLCVSGGFLAFNTKTVSADEQATLTLKLNGGFQVTSYASEGATATYSETDVSYSLNKGALVLTHENVRSMFGNKPVYSKATETNTTGFERTAEGYYHAPTNSDGGTAFTDLLFGVYEDTDEDGVLDDGEKLYRSGDTLDVLGDMTLTCYYEGQNVYESNDEHDRNTNVVLRKAWKDFSNAREYYTPSDLQPFYHTLVAIGNFGFSLDTYTGTIRGVELPNTVKKIGAKAFALTTRLEYVKGTENVRMYDNEAFWAAGVDVSSNFRLEVAGPDNDVATYAFAFAKTNVEARILYTASNYYRKIGDNWRDNKHQFTKDKSEGVSFEDPCVYAYVLYGKTEEMYIDEKDYAKSSMMANYSEDAEGNVTLVRVNTPVREMYTVSFDLAGGNINGVTTLKNTYMDARAVSVTRANSEANLTVKNEAGNLIRSYNPAEQTLSLLPAEKPTDPTKEGYVFGGWKDQNGRVWTSEDWANGGYAYNYGADGVKLTAVWYDKAYVNLSLDGMIGVNYYFDAEGWDRNGAKVEFTDENGQVLNTVPANSGETVNMNNRQYLVYVMRVAPKDADKKITASLVLANSTVQHSVSLSVNDYVDVILKNPETYAKEQDLVKALQAYVNASKAYFAGETVEVADVNTENLTATYTSAGALRGMNFLGTSLLLESGTTLRYYFTMDEGLTVDNFSIYLQLVGSIDIQYDEVNGLYYFEMTNITAADLDKEIKFEITYKPNIGSAEGSWIQGSALGYINAVLQSNESENLKNLVKYLYDYNQKANAYFAS